MASHRTWLAIAALTIALTSPSPARADNVDYKLNFATISGTAKVHKNLAEWNLYIRDPKPNDRGVYGKVKIDFNNYWDMRTKRSKTTKGGGPPVRLGGHLKDGKVQGLRVYLCEERPRGDHCREVAYIAET